MKYQQLENLESGWKWKYLVKKHREGELITRYIENSAAQEAVNELLKLENEPVKVLAWIAAHMNPELDNRMKQTIRARRKRHFNAEHQHTRKKSIDLEFLVWQRLAAWRAVVASRCRKRLCSLSKMLSAKRSMRIRCRR